MTEFVKVKEATSTGYALCVIGGVFDGAYMHSNTRRGRVNGYGFICPTITATANQIYRIERNEEMAEKDEIMAIDEQNMNIRKDGCVGTIMTDGSSPKHNNRILEAKDFRIRRLTPCECFKLMGVDESDFRKAEAVCSNSQLFKQAGNSIVVDCLAAMYQMLL